MSVTPKFEKYMPVKRPVGLATRKKKPTTIDPIEALKIALNHDVETAWTLMYQKLREIGFQHCAFGICRRSAETPIGHPDTLLFSHFVNKSFQDMMRDKPELQRLSAHLQTIRLTDRPRSWFDKDACVHATVDQAEAYQRHMAKFQIKGRALVPYHVPDSDCMMVLGWWDFDDEKKAEALWKTHGGAFNLAANYFAQGLLLSGRLPLCGKTEKLSPREKECLLWAAIGHTTAQIAKLIGVTAATVDEYITRAMRKLGAKTRIQACTTAIVASIITP